MLPSILQFKNVTEAEGRHGRPSQEQPKVLEAPVIVQLLNTKPYGWFSVLLLAVRIPPLFGPRSKNSKVVLSNQAGPSPQMKSTVPAMWQ